MVNVDASTSLIQGRDLEPEKSAVILASKGFYANEEEEHETHDSANEAWEEESGISAMEDSPRLSAEEGEDEGTYGPLLTLFVASKIAWKLKCLFSRLAWEHQN